MKTKKETGIFVGVNTTAMHWSCGRKKMGYYCHMYTAILVPGNKAQAIRLNKNSYRPTTRKGQSFKLYRDGTASPFSLLASTVDIRNLKSLF